MANAFNYTFDNMSRLGEDPCYLSERDRQNSVYGNYHVTNYFNNCGLKDEISFATSQPNIFINGGYGHSGVNGCNIQADSAMKIGTIQTKPNGRISLYTRPFLTVPYLGKGSHNPVEESKIQQGQYIRNVKSCNTTTETTHIDHRHYPLIPSLKATVTNPHNLVEGVAAEGWIRGGVPTRELIRDKNYMQFQNK